MRAQREGGEIGIGSVGMRVVGMISGTSVDAVDVVICDLAPDAGAAPGALTLRLVAHAEHPYPPELRARVLRLFREGAAPLDELTELNFLIGDAFAGAAMETLRAAELAPEGVDLVASHGQTVYHLVEPGRVRSTWQTGEAAVIARRTGVTTVSDFRTADVAAGGQGAPLVSFLDALMFSDPYRTRALQNIGGIGNVTFLPAGAGSEGAYAFDTGPGNALLDRAARVFSGGARAYDRDGELARAGTPHAGLLEHALAHPYYAQPPPKSTGRELFGDEYADRLIERARSLGPSEADMMATLAALTAESIARAYRAFGPERIDEMIVSGGGARNPALMDRLRAALPGVRVVPYDEYGLPGGIKEAVAFALLGHECVHGRPASLPRCTGAAERAVLGKITPGRNYRALLERVEREDGWNSTRALRSIR